MVDMAETDQSMIDNLPEAAEDTDGEARAL